MFEIGYSEILVIAIVLIVVVGPKDLPKMLRAFGKTMTKFRQMSGDFQRQFNEALKDAELDDVRKTIADVRKLDPRQQVRDVLNPLLNVGNSLKADLNKAVQAPVTPAMTAARLDPKPIEVTNGGAKPVAKQKPTAKALPKSAATKRTTKTAAKPEAKPVAKPTAKVATKAAPKASAKMAAPMAPTKKAAAVPIAAKFKQSKGKTDK